MLAGILRMMIVELIAQFVVATRPHQLQLSSLSLTGHVSYIVALLYSIMHTRCSLAYRSSCKHHAMPIKPGKSRGPKDGHHNATSEAGQMFPRPT